jgi:NAD(P)-dependent dehydrogenase (short-subunit alcohol dehydrogenase family)
VTGGAGGIGRAGRLAFAGEGGARGSLTFARVALFLVSPQGPFMVEYAAPVDGGLIAR